MELKWREAEVITNRQVLDEFDQRHRREFQTPLPCKVCVDETLRKLRFLTERGVLTGKESIVKVPNSYHVVALLVLAEEQEAWPMCLEHLYEFAAESGCEGVKKQGHLRLVKRDEQK